jgi:CDP-4-dehydro-6-deoxyglucose reductase, E3
MRVTLQPSGAVLDLAAGRADSEAAQRLGYECPQSCRNGNCHVCAALLVEGRVQQAGEVRDHGEFYTCLASRWKTASCCGMACLRWESYRCAALACQLTECVDMGGDVWRVRLRAPAGKAVRYHAGQYLMIERENGEKSAFSLASAPHAGRELELHVLVREDSARSLIEQLQRNQMARVELPFGDTHLAELPDGPLVLIAAGTGMAQMHSLIEHCRATGFKYPVHLYWGVRRPEDFYPGRTLGTVAAIAQSVPAQSGQRPVWLGRALWLVARGGVRRHNRPQGRACLCQRIAGDDLRHAGRAGECRDGCAPDAR